MARIEVADIVRVQIIDRHNNLAQRFLAWTIKEGISQICPGSYVGWKLIAYFRPEDASRVREWLEAHNKKEADEQQKELRSPSG